MWESTRPMFWWVGFLLIFYGIVTIINKKFNFKNSSKYDEQDAIFVGVFLVIWGLVIIYIRIRSRSKKK
jgi:uncharacterized membrane protein